MVFGTMDNGWSAKHSASISGLAYNEVFTLSVHASGHLYTVYLDGQVIIEKVLRTEFSGGSIGLRTYYAPTTFHSVTYTAINGYGPQLANRQCIVYDTEYDGDRLDNPIFEGGGFIGTLTLADCMAHCDLSSDSKGRECVAIEWSDGGQLRSSSITKKCALVWGCDDTSNWGGGSVYQRLADPTPEPTAEPSVSPSPAPSAEPTLEPFNGEIVADVLFSKVRPVTCAANQVVNVVDILDEMHFEMVCSVVGPHDF